jgi:flagellar protein FlgJ
VSSSWAQPRSSNSAAIPENESFQQAFEGAKKEVDTPEKLAGVAKQFEALMVGQVLKTARESSGGGWLSDEDGQDDQTGSMVMELGEQGFAQAIAARGGLGIAKMVTTQIERRQAKTPSSDSENPAPASPLKNRNRMNMGTNAK